MPKKLKRQDPDDSQQTDLSPSDQPLDHDFPWFVDTVGCEPKHIPIRPLREPRASPKKKRKYNLPPRKESGIRVTASLDYKFEKDPLLDKDTGLLVLPPKPPPNLQSKYKNEPCTYCGNLNRLRRNRVVPHRRGGTLNLLICKSCSESKQDLYLLDWLVLLPRESVQWSFIPQLLPHLMEKKVDLIDPLYSPFEETDTVSENLSHTIAEMVRFLKVGEPPRMLKTPEQEQKKKKHDMRSSKSAERPTKEDPVSAITRRTFHLSLQGEVTKEDLITRLTEMDEARILNHFEFLS